MTVTSGPGIGVVGRGFFLREESQFCKTRAKLCTY